MGKIIEGKKIPTFKADATNDSVFDLKNNKKNLVIYFYPKDNTPGCTTEGENFRDLYKKFKELISDPQTQLIQSLNAWKEKSMYGKKYMGIERSTFLIDSNNKLIKEWRKVKVPGHAQEVLETLEEYLKS